MLIIVSITLAAVRYGLAKLLSKSKSGFSSAVRSSVFVFKEDLQLHVDVSLHVTFWCVSNSYCKSFAARGQGAEGCSSEPAVVAALTAWRRILFSLILDCCNIAANLVYVRSPRSERSQNGRLMIGTVRS
ncbi:hypothetical protein [Muricoccus aerilatus]|uniref:hypothetical protein n=1 Tax=Muricoccus aerilatus TaxID=452982 RepID=UPI0012EBF32A|nr:hypothetical protein [Roseomonas aerilata]